MTWPTLALALGGPPTLVPCWNVKVQVAQLLERMEEPDFWSLLPAQWAPVEYWSAN